MIYFVGIHNKPGLTPLDSRSHTGRIIDKIIAQVGEAVKTNFIDGYALPADLTGYGWAWHGRHILYKGDIVVLLGKIVQKHFQRIPGVLFIHADHPSSFTVRRKVAAYVDDLSLRILAPPETYHFPLKGGGHSSWLSMPTAEQLEAVQEMADFFYEQRK